MKYLIVGLRNKDEEFNETRHNVGFLVVENITEIIEGSFKII